MPGPPELPGSTAPRIVVICRVTGPLPYASRLRTVGRAAEPSGRARERPVPRVADERDRRAALRRRERERRDSRDPGTRSTARSFVDVERDDRRRERATAGACRHAGLRMPATTCAFVTTSPRVATQPDPSTPSPQAIPVTRTTLFDARTTSGSFASPLSGGATIAGGPRNTPIGSTRSSSSSSRSGGNDVVDLGEDRRALHRAAEVGLARADRGARRRSPSRGRRRRRARARARRSDRAGACPESRRCSCGAPRRASRRARA